MSRARPSKKPAPATRDDARPSKEPAPATRDDAKQLTRVALVQAALELFAEQGLDVPSLDAICDRAGYTRGAFYVHFKTREDLLVAVMDHVGEAFLASVFLDFAGGGSASPTEPKASARRKPARARRLHHAVRRFVEAVSSGAYPLMASGGRGPLVRPHQLLDACARSAVVRARYRELVQLSVGAVASLVSADQDEGEVRRDVEAETVASMALALVIGAQTMSDLGLVLEPSALADAIERMLSPSANRAPRGA
jgi:AcrR family transcriptional regulator